MSKTKILIQLDPDPHASVFDAVVAVDSGVERLLQYASVEPQQVQGLVHGAIFTRGGPDLASTAIFIGGEPPPPGILGMAAQQRTAATMPDRDRFAKSPRQVPGGAPSG